MARRIAQCLCRTWLKKNHFHQDARGGCGASWLNGQLPLRLDGYTPGHRINRIHKAAPKDQTGSVPWAGTTVQAQGTGHTQKDREREREKKKTDREAHTLSANVDRNQTYADRLVEHLALRKLLEGTLSHSLQCETQPRAQSVFKGCFRALGATLFLTQPESSPGFRQQVGVLLKHQAVQYVL